MKHTCFVTMLIFVAMAFAIAPSMAQPAFEQPALITSAGQSADVTLAGMLFKKLNLKATTSARATSSDLDGIKTLVIVPGFSSKGLGAAGISREQEMTRIKELIAAAEKKNIPVLTLHIGGKPRRGQQSDDFNTLAVNAAKQLIVVKQGDEDGFFTKLAATGKKPIIVVGKIAEASQPLAGLFK